MGEYSIDGKVLYLCGDFAGYRQRVKQHEGQRTYSWSAVGPELTKNRAKEAKGDEVGTPRSDPNLVMPTVTLPLHTSSAPLKTLHEKGEYVI